MNLTKDELNMLQELLNEQILDYLRSGFSLNNEYVIILRNLLKKFNLKEVYNFDKFDKEIK